MSVDVGVLPGKKGFFAFGELDEQLRRDPLFVQVASEFGGYRSIVRLPQKTAVHLEEKINPPCAIAFEMARSNTLVLFLHSLSKVGYSDYDIINDLGKTLQEPKRLEVANKYYESGYDFEISSYAGRTANEPKLLVAIASCIADLCEGYIAILDDGFFSLPRGLYSAHDFRKATPLFTGIGSFSLKVDPDKASKVILEDGTEFTV